MTKKWEEAAADEIINRFFRKGARVGVRDFEYVKRLLAKQRTQLLARVREEVVGEEINILIEVHKRAEKEKRVVVDMKGLLNQLKKEQLKKLKIISEEVKE